MKRYTKQDIEYHRLGYGYSRAPAVDVKAHSAPYLAGKVVERFKCSRETAETALQYVWESVVEQFWEDAPELVEFHLSKAFHLRSYKVYSEGRSGGWLYVDEIQGDVDDWDAIKVSAWGRFEAALRGSVTYLTSEEYAMEMIEANKWAPAEDNQEEPLTS